MDERNTLSIFFFISLITKTDNVDNSIEKKKPSAVNSKHNISVTDGKETIKPQITQITVLFCISKIDTIITVVSAIKTKENNQLIHGKSK